MDDGLGEDEVDVRDRCRGHCPSWHLQLHVRALFDFRLTSYTPTPSAPKHALAWNTYGKRLSQMGVLLADMWLGERLIPLMGGLRGLQPLIN